jgi:hypothetical protein
VADFTHTQNVLINTGLDIFYTAVFYDRIFYGQIDPDNYTKYFYVKNITKVISSVSGAMQVALTSTYET